MPRPNRHPFADLYPGVAADAQRMAEPVPESVRSGRVPMRMTVPAESGAVAALMRWMGRLFGQDVLAAEKARKEEWTPPPGWRRSPTHPHGNRAYRRRMAHMMRAAAVVPRRRKYEKRYPR